MQADTDATKAPAQEKKKAKAYWTDPKRLHLIEAYQKMLDKSVQGVIRKGKTDSGLSTHQWNELVEGYNRLSGDSYTKEQLQSQVQILKNKYQAYHALKQLSGNGWDAETQKVTMSKEAWDAYCEAHEDAKEFRDKPFHLYEDLVPIFSGRAATGAGSISSTGVKAEHIDLTEDSEKFKHKRQRIGYQEEIKDVLKIVQTVAATPEKITAVENVVTPTKELVSTDQEYLKLLHTVTAMSNLSKDIIAKALLYFEANGRLSLFQAFNALADDDMRFHFITSLLEK